MLLLIIPFICPSICLSNKTLVTEFSAPITAIVFKFCIHLERGQVYCEKENQDSVISFCLLFPFFLFSMSHSNVICVKDFSGTTLPRILKFGTNVGYDLLYCVRENEPPDAYHSPYLSIFLSLQANFLLQISQLLWESDFKFCIHIESGQVYCGTENKTFIFSYFSFFPSLNPL